MYYRSCIWVSHHLPTWRQTSDVYFEIIMACLPTLPPFREARRVFRNLFHEKKVLGLLSPFLPPFSICTPYVHCSAPLPSRKSPHPFSLSLIFPSNLIYLHRRINWICTVCRTYIISHSALLFLPASLLPTFYLQRFWS